MDEFVNMFNELGEMLQSGHEWGTDHHQRKEQYEYFLKLKSILEKKQDVDFKFPTKEQYKELDGLMTYILDEMWGNDDKPLIREAIIAYANKWHEVQSPNNHEYLDIISGIVANSATTLEDAELYMKHSNNLVRDSLIVKKLSNAGMTRSNILPVIKAMNV